MVEHQNIDNKRNIGHSSSLWTTAKQSTVQKGRDGEDRACEYLLSHGYEIVDRNFRTRGGEIDIIALIGEYIVFVEVKRLPHGTIEMLAAELSPVKQRKIIKTSKCYLQKYRKYSNRFVRYDVLAIDVPGLDAVHHIANAFLE